MPVPQSLFEEQLKEDGVDAADIPTLTLGDPKVEKARKAAEQQFLAMALTYSLNRTTYGHEVLEYERMYSRAKTPEEKKEVWFKNTSEVHSHFLYSRRASTRRGDDYAGGYRNGGTQQFNRQLPDAETKVDETAKTGCVHCGGPHHFEKCHLPTAEEKQELNALIAQVVAKLGQGATDKIRGIVAHAKEGGQAGEVAKNLLKHILLDNCANVSSASSAITNGKTRKSNRPIRVGCNARDVTLDKELTFGRADFHVNDDSLENVLSVCDTKKLGYRIRYVRSGWTTRDGVSGSYPRME